MCTLPTERGINSPLMDLSSWIYDLKMSFYMKLGCRMFPLKPSSFDVMKKKKKKSQPAPALLFLFAFRLSLLSLFIKSSISYGLRRCLPFIL